MFSLVTDRPALSAQHSHNGSSKDWPKIVAAPLNGDPKNWRKFDQGVQATIVDTNMPDSRKLLQLQSLLVDEIRKTVKETHISSPACTPFNKHMTN